jgi:hypothetical protein
MNTVDVLATICYSESNEKNQSFIYYRTARKTYGVANGLHILSECNGSPGPQSTWNERPMNKPTSMYIPSVRVFPYH